MFFGPGYVFHCDCVYFAELVETKAAAVDQNKGELPAFVAAEIRAGFLVRCLFAFGVIKVIFAAYVAVADF